MTNHEKNRKLNMAFKISFTVFMDLSKAFDTLDHKI